MIAPVLDRWFARAALPVNLSAVVCIDPPDAQAATVAVNGSRWRDQIQFVVNRGPRTCVAGWNEAARRCEGDVIVGVADDFDPPEHWDRRLTGVAPAGWWEEDRVVAVSDGNVTDVFTLAILTRRRHGRFGYVFHPAYESMYADTEFTTVAGSEGAVLDGRALLFEHRHHDIGKRAKDAVDRRQVSRARWRRGERLFLARQQAGFPREPQAGPPSENTGGPDGVRFAVHVLANQDDFCLAETLRSILRQQRAGRATIAAVFLSCPDSYWSGRPTPDAERAQVRAVAEQLRSEWPDVDFRFELTAIAPWRVAAGSRAELETRARNAALGAIRRAGHAHCLVADGDELWRPGVLVALADLVRARRPSAIESRWLPVVGLPGYPVEAATDQATIYVAAHASFVTARRVCGVRTRLPGRGLVHFTATRRTVAEIVRKHRESSHYDDPAYDFEDWIANVLPRVRPGFVGVHMYRPQQIWPRVRRWEPAELAAMPASLRGFLGTETEAWWRPWWRRLCFRT